MTLADAIAILDREAPDPSHGLPEELFHYISRTTPLVNVDLLIKDENKGVLLSWRDDLFTGKGWHVPGGIIRFKETFEDRIKKVAQLEIGVDHIDHDPAPVAVNQLIIKEKKIRGHFISFLFNCRLPADFIPRNEGLSVRDPGHLKWHESCPPDLLKFHEIYRDYL